MFFSPFSYFPLSPPAHLSSLFQIRPVTKKRMYSSVLFSPYNTALQFVRAVIWCKVIEINIYNQIVDYCELS